MDAAKIDRDMEIFLGPNEKAASAAFGCLQAAARPILCAFLRNLHHCKCPDPDSQQDILQMTFVKMWEKRGNYQYRGVAQWIGWLQRIALNLCNDISEMPSGGLPPEETWTREAITQELLAIFEAIIRGLTGEERRSRLLHLVDVAVLGLDPNLSQETHRRQLLAAQLYYLDGASVAQIVETLNAGSSETPVTARMLDAWLMDGAVLRCLAFNELYWDNDSLACHLLGLETDTPPKVLTALLRQATAETPQGTPPSDWTWPEVALLLWRYRYADTVNELMLRFESTVSRAEIEALDDKAKARFPFSEQMASLLWSLNRKGGPKAQAAFAKPALWQRLTFQYVILDELAHRDILERLQPAAQQIDYTINLGTLGVWLERIREMLRNISGGPEGKADEQSRE